MERQSFIVYLSTYPPRKCGIATFTQDLAMAMDKLFNPSLKSKIVSLNDNGNSYDYSNEVLYKINDICVEDYIKIAQRINENDKIKLVNIQHEFKIFGSDYGENLLVFLEAVKKPIITTFHTVLPAPSEQRRIVIQSIARHSECLVVMSQLAVKILVQDYDLEESKIVVIPHGIHEVPYENDENLKKSLGYQDKILLTSFGFLRPDKGRQSSGRGYEYVLDALPNIITQFPNVLYLIIGETHPKVFKKEGERYRKFLEAKVKQLNLENYVMFINKFVSLEELFRYLKATDVYSCVSLNPDQIVSGTLSYAMGCGCAVISTPFLYAKEILTPKNGMLLPDFRNSASISKAVIKLLSNSNLRCELKKNAYSFTRQMTWRNIALLYKNLFDKFGNEFTEINKISKGADHIQTAQKALPYTLCYL